MMPSFRTRVAVSLLDEAQEFQRFQAADARETAEKLGVGVDVFFAENTAIRQIQQLYKVIHAPETVRPHAILVETVAGEGLERVAHAAARAGIGWVLINRKAPYVEALRDAYRGLAISTASTDQIEIGRIQGRQIRALMPMGEGLVLYIQGPGDTSAARERLQGTEQILAGTKLELKVVEGRWVEASGEQAAERWIRLKQHERCHPDVVACQNDAMAVGARRALLKAGGGLARVPLLGVDGVPAGGQRLVRMGHLAGTVVVPSNTGHVMQFLIEALRAGRELPAQILLSPSSCPDLEQIGVPQPGAERMFRG